MPPTATVPLSEGGYDLAPFLLSPDVQRIVGMALLPGSGDEALIIAQDGQIFRLRLAPKAGSEPFGDVSSKLIDDPANEEGLLGIALSPGFESDHRLYLYYTTGNPRRSVLSRWLAAGDRLNPGSEEVILEVDEPYANHNGGQLAFGPDGYLYIAVGDGGDQGDPHENGQNLAALLGKILRIDVSGERGYAIPPDNPFVDTPGARPEIYAYGLRNPWRFSFDQATGDLWAGDVGQDRWEEIDRIVAGGNYGWNVIEGFECYSDEDCSNEGLQMPRLVYGRAGGCAVTGGFVYDGPSMPELAGWYVYGDYCSGNIWAAGASSDAPPVLLAATGKQIPTFGEMPDGDLLVFAFDDGIYRLTRKP